MKITTRRLITGPKKMRIKSLLQTHKKQILLFRVTFRLRIPQHSKQKEWWFSCFRPEQVVGFLHAFSILSGRHHAMYSAYLSHHYTCILRHLHSYNLILGQQSVLEKFIILQIEKLWRNAKRPSAIINCGAETWHSWKGCDALIFFILFEITVHWCIYCTFHFDLSRERE